MGELKAEEYRRAAMVAALAVEMATKMADRQAGSADIGYIKLSAL